MQQRGVIEKKDGKNREETIMSGKTEKELTVQVSRVSIFVNIALMAMKFFAGVVAHSGAMIADAVHSASDVFGSFLVIIGANLSGKAADEEHPYGHERMECVISIILANILLLVGLGIGMNGMGKIFSGDYSALAVPGKLALAAAVISILVKEGLFWYTRFAAKQINSISLMAEAWHHRSDALSSIGSFIGIFGARLGYPVLDPVASVVIACFILKVAYDIFKETLDRMVDHACDEETEQAMRQLILSNEGVLALDLLRTRLFGSKMYVEVEIEADRDLPLYEAHNIAVQVHNGIEKGFPLVKHCVVHVNPAACADCLKEC